MPQAIKGKIPVQLKIVFELRYRQGFIYLDRCGRTINTIREYYPDWISALSQPSPQVASLINVETGTKFNFNSSKLDLSLDRASEGALDETEIARFAEEAENLTEIVIDQLTLVDFSRIGCRIWYLFPSDTMEEARDFLKSLQLSSASPALSSAFEGEVESSALAVTINGKDRKFRVGADVVERYAEVDLGDALLNISVQSLPSKERRRTLVQREKAKSRMRKNPLYATIIDVDAYRDDPQSVKAGEFVKSSHEKAEKGIYASI
jgi:hypothetical protein